MPEHSYISQPEDPNEPRIGITVEFTVKRNWFRHFDYQLSLSYYHQLLEKVQNNFKSKRISDNEFYEAAFNELDQVAKNKFTSREVMLIAIMNVLVNYFEVNRIVEKDYSFDVGMVCLIHLDFLRVPFTIFYQYSQYIQEALNPNRKILKGYFKESDELLSGGYISDGTKKCNMLNQLLIELARYEEDIYEGEDYDPEIDFDIWYQTITKHTSIETEED